MREAEPDARTRLRTAMRRLPLVIAVTLVGGGSALAFSLAQTEQYTAEATLLFREAGFDQQLFGGGGGFPIDPDREAATNVGLVSLTAVAELTAKDLGDPDIDKD